MTAASLCKPLHEVLFPDAVYLGEKSQQQQLVAKLRHLADEIESVLVEEGTDNRLDNLHDGQPMVCDRGLEARIASSHDAQTSGSQI